MEPDDPDSARQVQTPWASLHQRLGPRRAARRPGRRPGYRCYVGRVRRSGATMAFALNWQDDPTPLVIPLVQALTAAHR
jgi:hypothetical protein